MKMRLGLWCCSCKTQVMWKTLRNWVDLKLAKANVISVSAKSDKVQSSPADVRMQIQLICLHLPIYSEVCLTCCNYHLSLHPQRYISTTHLTTIKKQLLKTFFIHWRSLKRMAENLRSSGLSCLSTYLIRILLPLSEPTSLGGLFLLTASSSPSLSPSPCFFKAPSGNCCWIELHLSLSVSWTSHSLLYEFPLTSYKTKQLNSSTNSHTYC